MTEGGTVRFAYTSAQESLVSELRTYFTRLMDPTTAAALAADPVGPEMRRVVKQIAADRWLGIGWPEVHGGRALGPVEQFIFFEESVLAGVPLPTIGVNIIGPTLMEHGTEDQQRQYLPGIISGDLYFCIGYSEPEAGTDLAALTTSARVDGADLVISGTKTWTSYFSCATHCWLAVRTEPDEARHAGISVVVVPMDAPGITTSRLHLLNDHDIATVTFDSVRVPLANIIGGRAKGWGVINSQLRHERTTMGAPAAVTRIWNDVVDWATVAPNESGVVLDLPWVRANLARADVLLQTMRLMCWNNIDDLAHGRSNPAHISATKVYSTEGFLVALELLLEVLGSAGALAADDPHAALHGRAHAAYRHHLALTFGGGANEIQREIVASAGLGLPRSR